MKDKKSYSLSDLVAQCDPNATMSEALQDWEQAAPVRLEGANGMTAEDMKNRKSYSLTDLVVQCDPDAPMPETLREWDQAAPVGLEQVAIGDQMDMPPLVPTPGEPASAAPDRFSPEHQSRSGSRVE